MATTIQAIGDTIKIDKAFVSGQDRIAVNGQVAFEGKLNLATPQNFTAGSPEYTIEIQTVSKMTGAIAIHLQVHENGELLFGRK
jgi:hypothetical protein